MCKQVYKAVQYLFECMAQNTKLTPKIQLKVPNELWSQFMATVPRTKTTHEIICELIEERVKNAKQ